ncbi:MAG TPA: pyridoxal phosphate-dependent aminotransferase [Clostridiales bacterium]|jgi:cystathionine beta-lyase|nr:pyridoxal phosphate-dependent aminotransferase [Clostridiales bacterium]
MKFNFDEPIDRKDTLSIKYDFHRERMPENVIPLWVADMDFRTVPAVIEALEKAVLHGIYGYSSAKEEYYEAVSSWFRSRFDWNPDSSWLIITSGVVYAIATAVRTFTNEGDAIIIQPPVYHPFSRYVLINNRKLVTNPLILKNGRYEIDFDDFERKIRQERVKMFILCSPHNPVGRVWTREELIRLGDICVKYGVLVISDEIHSDFTYYGKKHTVFGSLKPEFRESSIICTAPTKTFNLAGLQVSNIFIANKKLRDDYLAEISRSASGHVGTMGLIACQAAYAHGAEWLDALKKYLEGNIEFVRSFLSARLPKIKLIEPQGTYLLWLDFRQLNMSEEEREEFLIQKAGIWLSKGTIFGREGTGFERMNIASPRLILKKALLQLERALI